MRRMPLFAVVLVVAAMALAACSSGGSNDDDSGMPMSDMHDMMDTSPAHGEEPAPVADGARVIPVQATSFEFTPDEITVRAGEDVAIELTATDVEHDFVVEGIEDHVAVADKGAPQTGGLRIDDPGEYTFYCSVAGHRAGGMEGTLTVLRDQGP